ncbi:unnamed protein product, partial [Urochloa humidicola]
DLRAGGARSLGAAPGEHEPGTATVRVLLGRLLLEEREFRVRPLWPPPWELPLPYCTLPPRRHKELQRKERRRHEELWRGGGLPARLLPIGASSRARSRLFLFSGSPRPRRRRIPMPAAAAGWQVRGAHTWEASLASGAGLLGLASRRLDLGSRMRWQTRWRGCWKPIWRLSCQNLAWQAI